MRLHDAFTAILCTMIAAAGWFYLTQSKAVQTLQGIESPRRNAARRKARRMGALSMLLLSPSFFWLIYETNPVASQISKPRATAALLLTAFALLSMMMFVLADLYLTMRVRRSIHRPPPDL